MNTIIPNQQPIYQQQARVDPNSGVVIAGKSAPPRRTVQPKYNNNNNSTGQSSKSEATSSSNNSQSSAAQTTETNPNNPVKHVTRDDLFFLEKKNFTDYDFFLKHLPEHVFTSPSKEAEVTFYSKTRDSIMKKIRGSKRNTSFEGKS